MNLSSDASVLRLTHEGITNFASLSNFDKKSSQNFPNTCKNGMPVIEVDSTNNIGSKASVVGSSVSSILLSRLITALNVAKHYGSIERVIKPQNVGCASFLETFKIEHDVFLSSKDKDEPKVPKTNISRIKIRK